MTAKLQEPDGELPDTGFKALVDSWNELIITCVQLPLKKRSDKQLELFDDVSVPWRELVT